MYYIKKKNVFKKNIIFFVFSGAEVRGQPEVGGRGFLHGRQRRRVAAARHAAQQDHNHPQHLLHLSGREAPRWVFLIFYSQILTVEPLYELLKAFLANYLPLRHLAKECTN